ncbi:mitochondrial ribosomal subunit S27-domain-containing protein [Multifurca ochricompacta]|uniref:Small ribosomal subunit protein mS33 n=1 Tax=Multifurca ochricompacta TaxID=376703 RepID=A0AAD4QJF5_9AGAM|nr:mitochondrial ribosomal subunit S27-domain-containing protein [Multifurca ochricompacta]
MASAPSRLAALTRLRSVIFQTSYNPTSQRTGAKYLKRRLRGPSMMDYYPQQLSISAINKEFGLDLIDEDEEQRLQDVADKKKRGKGAPKKAKSAADSRRAQRKR